MGKTKNQIDGNDGNMLMENSTNSRVMELISHEGLSASAFADRIGVQRSSISHISSGRNEPSVPLIKKIMQAFPQVNVEWLLMGVGSIYKDGSSPTPDTNVNNAVEPESLVVNSETPKETPEPVNNVKAEAEYIATSKPAPEYKAPERTIQESPKRNTAAPVSVAKENHPVDNNISDGGFPGFMFNGGFVVLNHDRKTYSFYRPE